MPRTVKIGIVGCGYWGPNLIRNFAALPEVEVAYACDLDEELLRAAARPYRVAKLTTRIDEVLADPAVDGVALATPPSTHGSLGEAVLRAGKHLWVEKPLCSTIGEAQRLVAAAKEARRHILVDHTFLYTPAVRKVRELVASGDLGEVLYLDSVRVNLGLFQSDSNVVWDLGPHDFSVAQFVLGREPKQVSAIAVRHVPGALESMAYVTLRYDGPLVAHFHENWLAPIKVRMTMIGGSRRMVVWDDLDPVEKVRVWDRGVDVKDADPEARRRTLISYRSGDLWSPRLEQTEALALAAKDFCEAIRDDRPPISNGSLGVSVMKVLEAAQESSRRDGAFVDVR